jgi:5-methylcytosine-specific restriction endonuclease McrA
MAKYQRDQHRCQKCGATRDTTRLLLHHMAPTRHGGSNTQDNLVLLCEQCHKKEHRNMWG